MDPKQMTCEIVAEFTRLSAIPHPSGQEQALAQELAQALRQMGGSVQFDRCWNLRCDLPATSGLETAPLVCIQGHLDMVCAQAPGSDYRPERDGIVCQVANGFLTSDGRSSLGADNLLPNVAALWLLRQSFPHGPLRLLLTTEEERALGGAKAMPPQWLDGVRYLINTDGFRPNRIIVGSAGGCYQIWRRKLESVPDARPAWKLELTGFPGGHSGADIGKGRVNPLRLLGTLLMETDADIAALSGGNAMNAIPSDACAVLIPKDVDALRQRLELVAELGGKAELTPVTEPVSVWSPIDRQAALDFLLSLPSGVLAWLPEQPQTPACSSNLGRVEWQEDTLLYHVFFRGTPQQALDRAANGCALLADRCGFDLAQEIGYPPWEGSQTNPLAQRLSQLWQARHGVPLEITQVHEGLEPSAFMPHHPELIAVIIGISILDAHSTKERARLADLPPFVQLLQDSLEEIARTGQ